MRRKRLFPTLKQILRLPPGRLYCGQGLLIKTTSIRSTRRSNHTWMFRYKKPTTGKYTETAIGSAYSFSEAEANNEMYRMRQLLAKGKDPVLEKRKDRAKGTTFAEASEGWLNKHKSKWRSTSQFEASLGKHAQPIAQLPVRSIDTPMVVRALSKLWQKHPEQGYRTSTVWARVFDYAKVMGMREGDNPATWRGNLEHIFHRPKSHGHYASIPFKDVPELMSRLRLREVKGMSALALQFQIFTATRPGETRGMLWSEVDLINRIWTLPPERTKQNRQHRVPLSEGCMRILTLQNEYRTCDFVFPGHNSGPLNPTAVDTLLRKMDVRVAPHGFRASFRNWAAQVHINGERIDRDLAEFCLGHLVKGQTEGRYWTDDTLEQCRPIMQAWAVFCG
jgi:integrase